MPVKITCNTKYPPSVGKKAQECAKKHQQSLDKWGHYSVVSIYLERSSNPLWDWDVYLHCVGWDTRTIEDMI